VALAALFTVAARPAPAQYIQHNLVSDQPNGAPRTDPNLVNAWGITSSPTGPLWISDNGTGVSTVYHGNGRPFPKEHSPLVVTIPSPAGVEGGDPTGVEFNGTSDFVITNAGGVSGPAIFIFAGENGALSGWNPAVNLTNAILTVDTSLSGAVYKGVALGSNASGNFLFVANFHDNRVDVFDSSFNFVYSFSDPTVPSDYAPFGIRNIGGLLYVTFAKQLPPENHDDDAGPGHGYLDVFDTNGNMLTQLAAQGTLNSPWGLAIAPADFGPFSGDLLVGNFGDGRINAFDPNTGEFKGQLPDVHGNALTINGLWGLTFGNGGLGGQTNRLFFTAGPDGESHGLFGRIQFGEGEDED
jgi:uncharacterized protein (TIGR03118 family)